MRITNGASGCTERPRQPRTHLTNSWALAHALGIGVCITVNACTGETVGLPLESRSYGGAVSVTRSGGASSGGNTNLTLGGASITGTANSGRTTITDAGSSSGGFIDSYSGGTHTDGGTSDRLTAGGQGGVSSALPSSNGGSGAGGALTGGTGGALTGGAGGAPTGGTSGALTGGTSGALTGGAGGTLTGGAGGTLTGGAGGTLTGGAGGTLTGGTGGTLTGGTSGALTGGSTSADCVDGGSNCAAVWMTIINASLLSDTNDISDAAINDAAANSIIACDDAGGCSTR